jgi:putative CocE/NonD family hydrolase
VGWFSFAGTKVKDAKAPDSLDYGSLLRMLPTSQIDRRGSFPPSDYEDFMTHPPADRYWRQMAYLSDSDHFDTPTLMVNSWGDVTPEQTLYAFNLMRRNALSARARDNQFVIMSPTVHCSSERVGAHTMVGALDVGDARLDYWKIYLDWFDHWLKGIDNGVERRPKVQYYEIGAGAWRTSDTWPVSGMRSVAYYLSSDRSARTGSGDGQLASAAPSAARTDTIVYDPANPFPSRGGGICCTGNPKDLPGIFDQRDLESRPDVLVYSTAPLSSPLSIAGPVRAVLYVSSDVKDSDIAAKLLDVDETGHAWNVANGILRLRYRGGLASPALMRADSVYRVQVNLNTVAWQFRPGHRIRLYVTSSDFPMYDRNLNTGGDNVTETQWVTAHNVVHIGAQSASALMLPVVPGNR